MKEKAEQQILEASKAENDISHQWQALQLQYSELREKEQFLARVSVKWYIVCMCGNPYFSGESVIGRAEKIPSICPSAKNPRSGEQF